jgi:hypothetical protein
LCRPQTCAVDKLRLEEMEEARPARAARDQDAKVHIRKLLAALLEEDLAQQRKRVDPKPPRREDDKA